MNRWKCRFSWKAALAAGWIAGFSGSMSAQPVNSFEVPQEARSQFEQGRQAVEQGNDAAAIGYFSAALRSVRRQRQEEYGEAHLALGEIYLRQKQYARAVQSFSAALAEQEEQLTDEQTAKAHHGRGKAYLEAGDPNSAISDFNEAAGIDWDNVEYLLDQATTLVTGRAADAAIEIATRILALEPQDPAQRASAYDVRGQGHGLLAKQKPGALESAMADFAKAIEIDPKDRKFYHHAGMILLQSERYSEAAGAFTKAIEAAQAAEAAAASSQPGTDSGAAAPSIESGAAKEETEEDKRPFVEPYLGRALTLIEMAKRLQPGDDRNQLLRQAAADAQAAIARVPLLPDAFLVWGVAHRLLEEYDQAIGLLTEALKLNPEYTEALYRRGIVWYYLDEPGLALADLTQAAQIAPDDARPPMWQGLVHAELGDYHAAVMHYGTAIERDSRFTSAYENRGLAYLQLAQLDKAVRDFDEVIRIDPRSAAAYHGRGVAYQMRGEWEQAAASFENALKFDPSLAAVRQSLAGIYRQLGKADQAAKVLQPVAQGGPPTAEPPLPGLGPTFGPPAAPLDAELLPAPSAPLEGPLGITPEMQGGGAAGSDPLALPASPASPPAGDLTPPPAEASPGSGPSDNLLDLLFPDSTPAAPPATP